MVDDGASDIPRLLIQTFQQRDGRVSGGIEWHRSHVLGHEVLSL